LCDGAGKVPSNCFLCSSTGKIKIIKTIETTETCLFCNGTGYTDK
jgi:DnaJ-class molecular chaperone